MTYPPLAARPGLRLPRRRRLTGLLVAVVGPPALTVALTAAHLTLAVELLLYLLLVIAAAAVGGLEPALVAAVVGVLLANWFLVAPVHTFSIERTDQLIELATFLVAGGVVSLTVHLAARNQARADRAALQTGLAARMAGEPVADGMLAAALGDVRDLLGLNGAALVRPDASVVQAVGDADDEPSLRVVTDDGFVLVGYGPELFGTDRRLLSTLAAAAVRAYETTELAQQAAVAQELATADRVRSGLLAAVGHDLRSPLAAIKAAVSSLRAEDVEFSAEERAELLETIEDGTDRLTGLVANLLDLSRLQAGSMPVRPVAVGLDEVVGAALLHQPAARAVVRLDDDLPLVLADPGLLERVVANLVDNAVRYDPDAMPEITAEVGERTVALRVVDHGPGVPPDRRDRMFVPFQRLDDRSSVAHLGLGLAIAVGFTEAMGGRLEPSTTAGGGLTMTVELPVAS